MSKAAGEMAFSKEFSKIRCSFLKRISILIFVMEVRNVCSSDSNVLPKRRCGLKRGPPSRS
jgi:hypothetical protein